MVTPAARREVVAHLRLAFEVSERGGQYTPRVALGPAIGVLGPAQAPTGAAPGPSPCLALAAPAPRPATPGPAVLSSLPLGTLAARPACPCV